MAWRFKVSKYKNAAPKFLKKEENILDLPMSDVTQSCGNHIKASCVYVAFNMDSGGGGNLGFLPLSASGRQGNSLPVIQAHGDFVTDFDFSPFDDYLLATGSLDNQVKLWLLPEESCLESVSTSVVSLPSFTRRVENVLWNPCAEGILAVSTDKSVKVFDVSQARSVESSSFDGHSDQVQGMSWRGDGTLLASTCRDKKIRVIDPRANAVVQIGSGHENVKDSRVMWIGCKDFVLSTGFSQTRSRQVKIWDPRALSSSLMTLDVDTSTGTIMPFYDEDTNMTFLLGKGDNSLNFMEFSEKDPYLTTAGTDRSEQIKGAALVPKRAMNLMDGEVNRLMLLCKNCIIPAPYIVPRKTYVDFHSDIFPDTSDGVPTLSADLWLQGQNAQPNKMKLAPGKHLVHRHQRGALIKGEKRDTNTKTLDIKTEISANGKGGPTTPPEPKPQPIVKSADSTITDNPRPVSNPPKPAQTSSSGPTKPQLQTKPEVVQEKPSPPKKPVKAFTTARVSKFRHIQGHVQHPNTFITNLRNVCKTVPGESNMFAANTKRCAVPIDGAGGCLQVFELADGARVPDTGVPVVQNGSKVTDFAWDPFNDRRLAVALDSAKVNVWLIPEGGLTETLDTPDMALRGHTEKIYFVVFHPLASDLLMTASYDMTLRLWDLTEGKEVMQFTDHPDQVFCLDWSSDGKKFATVCKDGKVRVFEPRKSSSALKEGPGPTGTRGARVSWVLDDKFLLVSGFSKQSQQQLLVYKSRDLQLLQTLDLNQSPAILIPHADRDTGVVHLTSRGERTIYTVEVSGDEPHLLECAPHRFDSLHQSVAYLAKSTCDVRRVEVARGWRLTTTSIEGFSFSVPRVKMEYFQDDLYPAALVTWEPTLSGQDWLAGGDKSPKRKNLRPSDMKPLSEAPVEAPKVRKFESYNQDTYKSDEQRKDELLSAITGKLELSTEPLPQDLTEGVDDDEWDD